MAELDSLFSRTVRSLIVPFLCTAVHVIFSFLPYHRSFSIIFSFSILFSLFVCLLSSFTFFLSILLFLSFYIFNIFLSFLAGKEMVSTSVKKLDRQDQKTRIRRSRQNNDILVC